MFQGEATINGEGSFTFKVIAEDNGEPGGSLSGSAVAWFLFKTKDSATSRQPAIPSLGYDSWSHPRPTLPSEHDCQMRELYVIEGRGE